MMIARAVAVTAHKSFSEYHQFIQDLKNKWADIITITDSFLISTNSDNAIRPLSFRYLFDR